jgi:hypothetical protein
MFFKICVLHGNIPRPRAHEVARPLRNEVDPKCRWTQGTTELGYIVEIDVKKDYRKSGARGPCLMIKKVNLSNQMVRKRKIKSRNMYQKSNTYPVMHIVGSWSMQRDRINNYNRKKI